ncbi:hypothetical protein [Burkholderia gladioli]|nr:hypothetical protein [Burkholderia gladioli]
MKTLPTAATDSVLSAPGSAGVSPSACLPPRDLGIDVMSACP